MEVLNKLYRSKELILFEDGYGGSSSFKYMYKYILFFNNTCYMFYSIKGYEVVGDNNHEKLKSTFKFDDKKTIDEIKIVLPRADKSIFEYIDEQTVQFKLPIQIADEEGGIINIHRNYHATFYHETKSLKLKGFNENNPDKIITESEFQWLDIDYERIESQLLSS